MPWNPHACFSESVSSSCYLSLTSLPYIFAHFCPLLTPPIHSTHNTIYSIDDILTGMRNQKYDAQREDKRPQEEKDEEAGGGGAIGED